MCKIIDYIKYTYWVDFKIDENHIVGYHNINSIVRASWPNEKFPIKVLISDLQKIYQKRSNNNCKKNYQINLLIKYYFLYNAIFVKVRKINDIIDDKYQLKNKNFK